MARLLVRIFRALATFTWLACALPTSAAAQLLHVAALLDVGQPLDGVPLGRLITVFEDPTGRLTAEQVRSPAFAHHFVAVRKDAPSFGYTDSVYWVRLEAENKTGENVRWLLDLQYPHLDQVALYVPRADGSYEARHTGDYLPFQQRDVVHRNFVFSLKEPAHSQRSYYLRVATTSAMSLPLVGWKINDFLEHQPRETGALFLFYGIVLAMACYNLCAFLLIRQVEYLYYVLYVLGMGILQLAINGHFHEFFAPSWPWLADKILPWSIAFTLFTSCFVGSICLPLEARPRSDRALRMAGWGSLLVGVLSTVLSYRLRMAVMGLTLLVMSGWMLVLTLQLLKVDRKRCGYFLAAWLSAVIGFGVVWLRSRGLLPSNLFTDWSPQLGSSLQLTLLASMTAERVNAMRLDLGDLNIELSNKVVALEGALLQAREATDRAERATRVKDEFLATMSHELRTPLNAIINVPQGLMRDFPTSVGVACSGCSTTFELEPDEKITGQTACPECGKLGALQPKTFMRYAGRPERTARFLAIVERSGKHLLQMVESVLDSRKLEMGRLELVLETFEVSHLVREVVDELTPTSERAGVQVELHNLPGLTPLMADPLRVKQVLINLLGNALKFSDGKGVVTVAVEQTADAFLFSVRDRGIGIAPENFERIFASFEQVHKGSTRKYGGTGLGLSISRSLVRMHGGELWVQSELGAGATFFFRIPKIHSVGRIHTTSARLKAVATPFLGEVRNEELVS